MKHILKRATSLMLVVAMILSLAPAAFAAGGDTGVTYYVANSTNGGSDNNGDGTQGTPYMTIGNAISKAKEAGATAVTINLLSDIGASLELKFDDAIPVTIQSNDGATYTIQYTGTSPIGSESGFIKATGSANLTFKNVKLAGSTGAYDGRVLYAADGAVVNLENVTVTNGRMNNPVNNQGGAGIFAAANGTINVSGSSTITDNETSGNGGGIYVADKGTVTLSDGVTVTNNSAGNFGGGIAAATQSSDKGGLTMTGNVTVTANTAKQGGSGMYVEQNAKAVVSGAVKVFDNKKGTDQSNVYLADEATLDLSDTTVDAKIGISADPEEAYRLVSLPKDGYTIQQTKNGDEKGWIDDCGTWDIRYMTYNNVPGLYLCYKTLDMTFENVNTLTGITGKDINGQNVDFLNDTLSSTSKSNGVLTVKDTATKNNGDLTISFTADPDNYRIPTQDVVHITSGGQDVPFTYTPDFEQGTATITIAADKVNELNDTIKFEISAEKYYDLTIRMEGPLYGMTSSITGLSDKALVLSESSKTGTTASYKITKNGQPVQGVTVELYQEETSAPGGTATTDENGVVSFTDLNETSSYYAILKYEKTYRVISRDLVSLKLSTLIGQTLADTCIQNPADGTVTYDKSTGNASITGITQNGTVTFSVNQAKDTITFVGNEGEATTKPAALSAQSKEMQANATTYGELATASLTGYDFVGWFTEAKGGEQVTENTAYTTGTSPRILYAHWTAQTDTAYEIQHWVEYAASGENVGYADGTTEIKIVDGTTYYLYTTKYHSDGTSDAVKDISSLDLKTAEMKSDVASWWARSGFQPTFEQDCKVLANGSSVFSIYYNRNSYQISFKTPIKAGTATSDVTYPPQSVRFGSAVGTLPQPSLPGYEFGGWYDGDTLVTAATIYNKQENTELTAHFNAKQDTKWAIKVMTQDIAKDENGVCKTTDSYTEMKTVYLNNDKQPLTGTTDTPVDFNISDIAELTFEGFNYVGYAASVDGTRTASTTSAKVYVKPTDATTDDNGQYNRAFDGGIVYLFYDRKTKKFTTEDGKGEEHPGNGDLVYGGDFTGLLPEAPKKDGYDFDHWVDSNDNIVTDKTPAQNYTDTNGDLKITPTWIARKYRLTYYPGLPSTHPTFVASNGTAGTESTSILGGYTDSNDVNYDAKMGTMPTAAKTGYTFDGWFVDTDATAPTIDGINPTTPITSETSVNVGNVVIHNDDYSHENTRVLVAKYTPHTYCFVLNPGQTKGGIPGTVDPERVNVTYDSAVSGLPEPSLTGYRFVGWTMKDNDTTTLVKNGDFWQKEYTNGAEINLYAQYVPENYKYTFDLNDTAGSTRASLVATDINHVEETFDSVYGGIFKVEAIRNGYDFKGWSLTKNGNVLTAADLVALAQDTTVYAKWEPKSYNVTFVMKGSKMNLADKVPLASYNENKDTWTMQVKFDTEFGPLPEPSKTDCRYLGWLADAKSWSEIHGKTIKSLPSYTDYQDADGITLTAVMDPQITFDPKGNQFKDNNSTEVKKVWQSEIKTLPEVKKDGYTFDGWTKESDPDDTLTVREVKRLEEPTKLVPKFSANITFNANGGTMSQNRQQTITLAISSMNRLPSASRSGYNLDGWYTTATGGTKVSLSDLAKENAPKTVFAHWTAASIGGGGGGGGGGGVSTVTITVTEDTGAKVTPNGKVSVSVGSDKHFDIKADDGYTITDVIVDGKSQGPMTSYDFKNIKEAHTLVVKASKLLRGDHIAFISGYPDGSVHPNANITRGEVSMIFYRLLADNVRAANSGSRAPYGDVASNAWYADAVATLSRMGILKGYEDGTFKPDAAVTRAEFATIASRFDKLATGTKTFKDVPASHWAYAAISSAAEKGWVSGYEDGTFRPDRAITRAEVAKLTNAVLNRSCDKNYVDTNKPSIKNFTDLPTSFWGYYEIMEAANAHDYNNNGSLETWTGLSK